MNKNQSSDSLKVAVFLAFIGGFLEIYSFLLKGRVFATTMTGNIILMIYNIYDLDFISIPKYLLPILSFSLGIVYVEYVRSKKRNSNIHWREFIILMEMCLVILVFIFKDEYFNIFTTSIIGFMSAVQIHSFSKVENTVYMSTMLTGNTRKFIESLIKRDTFKLKIFGFIILGFCFGVMAGAIFVQTLHQFSILLTLIPFSFVLYFIHNNI